MGGGLCRKAFQEEEPQRLEGVTDSGIMTDGQVVPLPGHMWVYVGRGGAKTELCHERSCVKYRRPWISS